MPDTATKPPPANALVVRDSLTTVKAVLAARANEFADLLPSRTDADRFLSIGLRALAKNPDLLTASHKSIVAAFFDAAQLRLEPVLGRVYFVKYGGEVVLLIGYSGLIELARRSGEIASIYARVVYEGDEFWVTYGTDQKIVHTPTFTTSDPTKITHAYAVVHYRDGSVDFEPMTREEIEKIRARSRAGNKGPWITDYAEMAKKTPLRRLTKRMPLTVDVMQAIERDDEREFGRGTVSTGDAAVKARDALKARLTGAQPAVEAAGAPIEGEVVSDDAADQQEPVADEQLSAEDAASLDELADKVLGPKQ